MKNTCIITCSFFDKNREVFDLSLVHVDFGADNSDLFLLKSVTLPFQLLAKFYDLINESLIMENGFYSHEYCHDLLQTIGEYILEEKRLYAPFFYPQNALKTDNSIKEDFIQDYNTTKKEIRQKKYEFFDCTSIKVLFFHNVLNLVKALGKKFYLQKKTITRQEFEVYIEDYETAIAYTDIYHNLDGFSLLFSKKTKLPICALGLDHKKKIILGIFTGKESLSI